jgi:hypothetical protein
MHGKGFARKVKAAMVDAVREKASAVVFVSDRGGERNRKRLEEMKNGRNEATADGIDVPTALGLAIEELEAWLLADETVVSDVTGAAVSGALPDPELDPDPKATLSKLWTQAADEAEAWRSYEAIAEKLDIGRLRRRCPRGFEPFHQEVRERLSPLASG